MTTPTTLKLPEALQERIAPLANAAGKTAHAWMVAALERQAALSEAREAFLADAEGAAAEIDAGGAPCAAEGVAAYLLARGAGMRAPARPRPLAPAATKSARKAAARRRR